MNVTSTGYFGLPGKFGGKVHAVKDGRPICGTPMHRLAVYMWCARGLIYEYMECERCRAKIRKQHDYAPS